MSGLATSLGLIACPAIVTGFLAARSAGAWIGLLCLGCIGTVAIGAALGRRLTQQQDRVEANIPELALSE